MCLSDDSCNWDSRLMFNRWGEIWTRTRGREVRTYEDNCEHARVREKVNRIQRGWCTGSTIGYTISHTHRGKYVSPDLVLQEVHVAVEQSVGGRQNSHRLHPRPSLQFALHRHVRETGQPKVGAFTKISSQGAKQRGEVNTQWQIPGRDWKDKCFLHTHMKSLVIRWEPLAMDLNSTPSRLMSWGRHHSTIFPAIHTENIPWSYFPRRLHSSWPLPLILRVSHAVAGGQTERESTDSATVTFCTLAPSVY